MHFPFTRQALLVGGLIAIFSKGSLPTFQPNRTVPLGYLLDP